MVQTATVTSVNGIEEITFNATLPPVRTFETGATRDSEDGKFDYEGFLSPIVLKRFGAYMHQHRKQSDGSMRDSDNWQKGMGQSVYIKSAWRHFMDWWTIHRGGTVKDKRDGHVVTIDEAICALLFNAQGYLHELLAAKLGGTEAKSPPRHTEAELDSLVKLVRKA